MAVDMLTICYTFEVVTRLSALHTILTLVTDSQDKLSCVIIYQFYLILDT